MRVVKLRGATSADVIVEVWDDADRPMPAISSFLRFLAARGYSPHTQSAYAYDLLHFFRFLAREGIPCERFVARQGLGFLQYLRELPSKRPTRRLGPVLGTAEAGQLVQRLSPESVNRALAAVSSFYEYLIVSGQWAVDENPLGKEADPQRARVAERHRPYMGRASMQRPVRRTLRVKTPERLPRPLSDELLSRIVGSLRTWRDRAMVLLMAQGGLRAGEVLNLHLDDVQYGRRRVVIRYRTDHPKGARTKSRRERVVDLHEPEALLAVCEYVRRERPRETGSPYLFLIGGRGRRRTEPLSYQGLQRMFKRHCLRLGIVDAHVTSHALRHTHATRMWEGGMRELSLQKRLGHASAESTHRYTRVADPVVVAEYRRAIGADAPS